MPAPQGLVWGPAYPPPSLTPGGSYQAPRPRTRVWVVLLNSVLILVLVAALVSHYEGFWRIPQAMRSPNQPIPPISRANDEQPVPTYPTPVTAELSAGVVLITGIAGDGVASGSGMILTSDGLVLTNYHVVSDTQQLSVQVADTGRTYDAVLLGRNVWEDIAVLQLQGASGLQTITTDDDDVAFGDRVVVVGNSHGGGVLVGSGGGIRALDAAIWLPSAFGGYGTDRLGGLLESTAGAVPGYSGGPTFDDEGEVIGVTSAGRDEPSQVMTTYSIPIDHAISIAADIIDGRESERTRVGPGPWVGVSMGTDDVATLTAVVPGSPADLAGISVGSTITSYRGTPITSANQLLKLLESSEPNDNVDIAWTTADGATREAIVTLGISPTN